MMAGYDLIDEIDRRYCLWSQGLAACSRDFPLGHGSTWRGRGSIGEVQRGWLCRRGCFLVGRIRSRASFWARGRANAWPRDYWRVRRDDRPQSQLRQNDFGLCTSRLSCLRKAKPFHLQFQLLTPRRPTPLFRFRHPPPKPFRRKTQRPCKRATGYSFPLPHQGRRRVSKNSPLQVRCWRLLFLVWLGRDGIFPGVPHRGRAPGGQRRTWPRT